MDRRSERTSENSLKELNVNDEVEKSLAKTRVAIVHEWPVVYAGSEQVVAAMLEVFPQAELFALVHDPDALCGTPLEGGTSPDIFHPVAA